MHPVESDEAYEAVVQLLEGGGVYCASDDLLVKKVITPAGHTLYVVIALNGLARAVENALAPLLSPQPCRVDGVWVLRQHEVCDLVRKASGHRNLIVSQSQ
jgi:hypothetical protein